MARYKGKREASRGSGESHKKEADPFVDSDSVWNGPEDTEKKKFWDSGKVTILLITVVCLALLGTAAGIAIKMLVKPPELPNAAREENQPSQSVDKISTTPDPTQTPGVSADDELYPDDGYGGDMPTVSGNRKEGVYTFLLVGTDMDDGNTDTIMVASYDTVHQNLSIMSIPRDTMINESWDIKKINSVYSRYKDGMDALKKRIKTLIGFTPDFYVKVDLTMFVKLVDLIDGVEFDVPQNMDYDDPYQNLHIHLKKGVQVLDGEKAMELVRFRRYSEGDIKRVEVQQNFMKALIKECLSLKHWGKVKAYIDLALENVQTDLEFGSVVWFAANVLGLNSGVSALSMDDVYTCTIPGDYWGEAWSRSTGQNQSYVTIYPKQVVTLVNERFNPYEQKVTTSMLDAMSILSNGNIASSTGSLRDTTHNSVMATRRGEGSKPAATTTKPKDDADSDPNAPTDDTTPNSGDPVLPNGIQSNPNAIGSSTNSSGNSKPGNTNAIPNESNASDPSSQTTPETPSDSGIAPIIPSEGGAEPELPTDPVTLPEASPDIPSTPAPEPAPAPEPEPSIDTAIPDWLLS